MALAKYVMEHPAQEGLKQWIKVRSADVQFENKSIPGDMSSCCLASILKMMLHTGEKVMAKNRKHPRTIFVLASLVLAGWTGSGSMGNRGNHRSSDKFSRFFHSIAIRLRRALQ
jgi:hypothetical protein